MGLTLLIETCILYFLQKLHPEVINLMIVRNTSNASYVIRHGSGQELQLQRVHFDNTEGRIQKYYSQHI